MQISTIETPKAKAERILRFWGAAYQQMPRGYVKANYIKALKRFFAEINE